jgi:hypothetical protein
MLTMLLLFLFSADEGDSVLVLGRLSSVDG